MKLLQDLIFRKFERVFTYVSYVFASKRGIVGFLGHDFYRSVGVWWPRTAKRKIHIFNWNYFPLSFKFLF